MAEFTANRSKKEYCVRRDKGKEIIARRTISLVCRLFLASRLRTLALITCTPSRSGDSRLKISLIVRFEDPLPAPCAATTTKKLSKSLNTARIATIASSFSPPPTLRSLSSLTLT
jgi:hypothetical protein